MATITIASGQLTNKTLAPWTGPRAEGVTTARRGEGDSFAPGPIAPGETIRLPADYRSSFAARREERMRAASDDWYFDARGRKIFVPHRVQLKRLGRAARLGGPDFHLEVLDAARKIVFSDFAFDVTSNLDADAFAALSTADKLTAISEEQRASVLWSWRATGGTDFALVLAAIDARLASGAAGP